MSSSSENSAIGLNAITIAPASKSGLVANDGFAIPKIPSRKPVDLNSKIQQILQSFQCDLKCTICCSVVKQACSLPCSHFFCQVCLDRMFSGVHKGNCPVCLKEFSRRQSVEDPVIRNLALAYRQLHDLTREQYDLGLLSQDVHGFSTSPPTALPPARSRSKSRATAAVSASNTSSSLVNAAASEAASPAASPSSTSTAASSSRGPKRDRSVSSTPRLSSVSSVISVSASSATTASAAASVSTPSSKRSRLSGHMDSDVKTDPVSHDRKSGGDEPVVVFTPSVKKASSVSGAAAPTCAVCCMTADAELGVSSDSESDDDDDSVDDKLLSCAKCGLMVHGWCYGQGDKLSDEDAAKWLCKSCSVAAASPKCCICPNVEDKALTPTTDGRWVHVACAYWHSQPCFVDADKREPVDLVAVPLEKERLKLKCVYCKKTGACLQCECKRCRRSYHVPCGLRSGCKFEIRPSATDADDIEMHTFCNKHVDMSGAQVRTTPSRKRKEQPARGAGSEPAGKRARSDPSATAASPSNFRSGSKRELFPTDGPAPMDSLDDAAASSISTGQSSKSASKPFVLAYTTLDDVQSDILRVAAFHLKATVVTELSKDVTHLITNALDSTGGLCTRTLKYMSTIVSRKPVVTFDWVTRSLEAQQWLPEGAFLVKGDRDGHGGVQRAVEAKQPLFKDCHFVHLRPESDRSMSTDSDVRTLVQLGGGTFHASLPYTDAQSLQDGRWIVIVSPGASLKQGAKDFCSKHSVPVTTRKWLFDCISNFDLLPYAPVTEVLQAGTRQHPVILASAVVAAGASSPSVDHPTVDDGAALRRSRSRDRR